LNTSEYPWKSRHRDHRGYIKSEKWDQTRKKINDRKKKKGEKFEEKWKRRRNDKEREDIKEERKHIQEG
jgi:hypothetical protein